jgi:hypothetical protein
MLNLVPLFFMVSKLGIYCVPDALLCEHIYRLGYLVPKMATKLEYGIQV